MTLLLLLGSRPGGGSSASLADGAAAADSLAPNVILGASLADGAAAADALSGAHLSRSLADGAAAAEVLAPNVHLFRALADGAAAADSLARTRVFGRGLADGASALDSLIPHPYIQPPAPPTPVPGSGSGPGHLYEVIAVDQYGVPYGTIDFAVPDEVTWELDQPGTAVVRFPILEPSAKSFLPMASIPAARELQIWRDGQLIQWVLPVTPQFDNAQVTVQCTDHLFFLQGRNFGPLVVEYLLNSDFENGLSNWAALNAIIAAPETSVVNTGKGAARLSLSFGTSIAAASNGVALPTSTINVLTTSGSPAAPATVLIYIGGVLTPVSYTSKTGTSFGGCTGGTGTLATGQSVFAAPGTLAQDVTLTAPPGLGTFFDVAVWYFIDPAVTFLGPSASGAGVICHATSGSIIPAGQAGPGDAFAPLTQNAPVGVWTRLELGFFVPAGTTATVRTSLCGVVGSIVFDTSQMRDQESVGTPIGGGELGNLLIDILNYAQDPTRGKTNDNINTWFSPAGPTGITLERHYQFSDNGIIMDAINEMPTDGYLDFAMAWSADGRQRGVTFYTPVKGGIKYNVPIEIGVDSVIQINGTIDGQKTKTTARVLGQGSTGTDRELGYAAFPSYLGGRVATDGAATQGSTTVTSATINFTAKDVGQGLYFQTAGIVPIGTVIAAVGSSTSVTISNAALQTTASAVIGVGGIILDSVSSAQPDRPMATLPVQATNQLNLTSVNLTTLTVRVQAGGPNGYMGLVYVGDVVPLLLNYGWAQLMQLMRITKMTLYPPTEELEITLVAVPGFNGSFGVTG